MDANITATTYLFADILISMIVTLVMSWFSVRLATRLKLIDIPGTAPHKLHDHPTPIAGGIALGLSLPLVAWIAGVISNQEIQIIFISSAIIFIFGMWDDIKPISPAIKLLGQILAGVLLIRLGVSVKFFESPEFFIKVSPAVAVYLDWLVTLFWVIGITNAFNFVDSMDGLAVGLGGTTAVFYLLVMLDSRQLFLSEFSALVIGLCIGLYFFNSPPARMFLGDAGAQTLGFILAVLAIIYRPLGANQSSSWIVPILLLGLPIFDMTLVIISRLRRKQPIYKGGHDHTYHHILQLGMGPNRAVLLMQIAALGLGCLSVILLTQPPLTTNIVFVSILLLAGILLLILENRFEN